METKANPRADGCLAKALPDEPFFVLLARDKATPGTIRLWGELRARLGIENEDPMDAEQLAEAFDTADAMEAWRAANEGKWRGHSPSWIPAIGQEVRVTTYKEWEGCPLWVTGLRALPDGNTEVTVSEAWPLTSSARLTDDFYPRDLRPALASEKAGA